MPPAEVDLRGAGPAAATMLLWAFGTARVAAVASATPLLAAAASGPEPRAAAIALWAVPAATAVRAVCEGRRETS